MDNGTISWIDLDLPEVITLRRPLIPETDRSRCVAGSLLDPAWMRKIGHAQGGLFLFAGGVMPYLTEQQVRSALSSIAEYLPRCEFMFDGVSWLGKFLSNLTIKKAGISAAPMKWAVGRRCDPGRWDARITVLDHFPLFQRIERSAQFDPKACRIMDRCDKRWSMSIFHLVIDEPATSIRQGHFILDTPGNPDFPLCAS